MSLKSKFRGSLLGTGIGDALGRSREARGMIDISDIKKLADDKTILQYTDDTQQMISLAEMLIEKEEFDGEYFAERLVKNFDPSRGYGPGSTQAIKAFERGESWEEPAKRSFGGEGSYGNGSSMRTAPAGLFCYDDLANLRSFVKDCSRITHDHRLGVEGAILQSASIAIAVREDPSSIDSLDFLEKIRNYVKENEYLEKLEVIGELLRSDPDRRKFIRSLGNGVEAFNSVPTAVYCFLSNMESFEQAVAYSISLGGDADTIGAMTGAISGAFHGFESIPDGWIEKLEDKIRIIGLADELFEVKRG
ncbi:hypothetical protein AKJ50_01540 [candidate division MSBL1 archaeon SCGC-AAA382A13]|uniref:ADP-ribosylglycohydrolase n=1 Tax=candidate division MSBL1 archaeon SCGC-AAA382A13 TaxID=1698279 RepID=A0A133VFH2_9EURY|nr:hypothetical protein AKJ50_01540 [candidate division MSBL1 archaeon SCGC-AAA382A13]